MNNVRYILDTIYQFKREYGCELTYVEVLASESNVETGSRNINKRINVIQAVLLPRRNQRKFIQDISYLAANKNFTYGGLSDYESVTLVISSEDLPSQIQIDLNGYFILDGQRYEKTEFTKLDHEVGYILMGKAVKGSITYSLTNLNVSNNLTMGHSVTNELN